MGRRVFTSLCMNDTFDGKIENLQKCSNCTYNVVLVMKNMISDVAGHFIDEVIFH